MTLPQYGMTLRLARQLFLCTLLLCGGMLSPTRASIQSSTASSGWQQLAPMKVDTGHLRSEYAARGESIYGNHAKPVVFENFSLNTTLFRAINSHTSRPLDTFFYYYSYLGNGIVLGPVLIALILWGRKKIRYLLLTVALETALVQVMKAVWFQPRPPAVLDHVLVFPPPFLQHSFPSGDTAVAFAIAASLLPGEKLWCKLLLLGYAVLIGVERIYIGVHFPLDVATGAAIGIVSAICAYRIFALPEWRARQRTAAIPATQAVQTAE